MKKAGQHWPKVRKLITRALDDGVYLSFFLPDEEIRDPTWEEAKGLAWQCYLAALGDVLIAMDGNPQPLKEALSEAGRLIVRVEDMPAFEKKVGELVKDLEESFLKKGSEEIPF
ncbi:MAG: hypothetical protein FJY85_24780 [Deltaproteobacteria bacterium]|nr:hypothetical protein [Deltaproteobacteria bacterium]